MTPMVEPVSTAETSSLVQGLRVIRERWWLVLGAVVVLGAGALALSISETKMYSASSELLIQPSRLAGTIDPTQVNNGDPARDTSTALLIVSSTNVAQRVKAALKLPEDPGTLLSELTATEEPDANLVHVTVKDADPVRAKNLANAFAQQFVLYRQQSEQNEIAQGEALLNKQLQALPVLPSNRQQRLGLENSLLKVTSLRAVTTGGAEVADLATVPTSASSPQPKRNAILGALIGLVVGLAAAFVIDLFDRRVKSSEEAEALYGFRALSTIPLRVRDPSSQRDRQAALEPFRILRNGLGFLSPTADIRVVLVTSAVPGEGKSTIAAGLARATALSGQKVVLVEVDLRRPTFHEQFDLGDDQRGLTTALVGGAPAKDLIRNVLPGLRTLSVLPSGPVPPNAAELLRSAQMERVLEDLAEIADVVILDAPPLVPVADTQVLLEQPRVDACLVVAREYRTTRDQIRSARAILDRLRPVSTGLVVNGAREAIEGYEYYGGVEPPTPAPAR